MESNRPELANSVAWHDDWYAVEPIAPGVTAIGEPRYHQLNWHYLIEGEHQALLFDTGPGERNIDPVVRVLTNRPVAAMASHMHYDHTGNLCRFKEVWVADLPELRRCEQPDGMLVVPETLHLGSHEDRPWIPVQSSRWIAPGSTIDLGGRQLEVFATPGHAIDHIALYDRAANILFASDFLYHGELYAQIPGSNLAAYLEAARRLTTAINDRTLILGAHGQPDGVGAHAAPRLAFTDLADLIRTLKNLKASGAQPEKIVVNGRMVLLTSPNAYSAWQKL